MRIIVSLVAIFSRGGSAFRDWKFQYRDVRVNVSSEGRETEVRRVLVTGAIFRLRVSGKKEILDREYRISHFFFRATRSAAKKPACVPQFQGARNVENNWARRALLSLSVVVALAVMAVSVRAAGRQVPRKSKQQHRAWKKERKEKAREEGRRHLSWRTRECEGMLRSRTRSTESLSLRVCVSRKKNTSITLARTPLPYCVLH